MPVKMKIFFTFLNYFLICITPVFADQFGMLYGMFTSPTGETRLYSNGDEVALKSDKPTTGLFLGLENLRVSYLEYQMMASKGEPPHRQICLWEFRCLPLNIRNFFLMKGITFILDFLTLLRNSNTITETLLM